MLGLQTVVLAGVVAVSLVRAPTMATVLPVFSSCPRCTAADQVVAEIPDGARVAADVFLMPHLVDRAQVMQAYPGFKDSTGLPIRADWVVLDLDSTSYKPGWSRTLAADLVASGHFAEVGRAGEFVVLHVT